MSRNSDKREKLEKGLISISYAQLEMKRIKYNVPQILRENERARERLTH